MPYQFDSLVMLLEKYRVEEYLLLLIRVPLRVSEGCNDPLLYSLAGTLTMHLSCHTGKH